MLIALNLLYLIPGVVGGTETYARSLVQALARQDSDNEYAIFVSREAADLEITPAANFRKVVCPVIAMSRAFRYSWEQTMLPLQLLREKPALTHSLGYVSPLAAPGPQVVSVHDVNYLGHTGRRTALGRRAFQFFVERTVQRAERVITISEFSKGEIIRHMNVPATKVTVIHLAGKQTVTDQKEVNGAAELLRDIGRPYIMAFSSLSAHKNIGRLIAAYTKISHSVPHALVLVGHLPEKSSARSEMESAETDRIHFTGHLPDADVDALMQNASLFAFPSLYEGFGMPVIDAQQAGVPVACSSAGALPEVAGDGAVVFDPHSVDDMASALQRCLLDIDLRQTLVADGYENARRFSWDRAARETLRVYAEVTS
ncbi:MAG TPA: glycosyltransferase family 1 protein [Gemmatimonadaceae bacterium]|nr:glycosyltransferase family 1 protein [Gemmatimonadaceae bacterium]